MIEACVLQQLPVSSFETVSSGSEQYRTELNMLFEQWNTKTKNASPFSKLYFDNM